MNLMTLVVRGVRYTFDREGVTVFNQGVVAFHLKGSEGYHDTVAYLNGLSKAIS